MPILPPRMGLKIMQGDNPTFYRDFAFNKTLDHGTGPSITFTRTGTATYFDASGTLTTATANTPRFDHNPVTLESNGLLIEEGRTNSIRNSEATGGTAGSPGTLPTNWTATGTVNNVTRTIVGSGTENGLNYLDIRYDGTPSATASPTIAFDSSSQVVATNGQTWTGSVYCKLQAGSLTNVSNFRIGTDGRDAAGAALSPLQRTTTNIAPTSSPLRQQRFSATHTMADASVGRAWTFLIFGYTSGQAINLTLRIAAPQLEQGAFATSYIPTTSAAVTRGADVAVVTPISSFYNQNEGALFAEFSRYQTTGVADFLQFSGTSPNQIVLENNATSPSTLQRLLVETSAGTQANIAFSGVVANTVYRLIGAYAANSFQVAQNGTLGTEDTSGAPPTVSQMTIGAGKYGTNTAFKILNGHIRKVAYWNKRLPNARLQAITA